MGCNIQDEHRLMLHLGERANFNPFFSISATDTVDGMNRTLCVSAAWYTSADTMSVNRFKKIEVAVTTIHFYWPERTQAQTSLKEQSRACNTTKKQNDRLLKWQWERC